MAQKTWLLLTLASFLFCTVLCQVENSSEEAEKDQSREAKYITPSFGRFPIGSAPCSSAEDAIETSKTTGLDPDNIVISRVTVEEKGPSNSDIAELLQLLREFKKHNFGVPKYSGHFIDPTHFRFIHQSMQSSEEIPTDKGELTQMGFMGYPPFYPYHLPLNPCLMSLCGFGPCQLDNHSFKSRSWNPDLLEQTVSSTLSTSTLPITTFENSFDPPNSLQDSFSTPNYPSTTSFLSQPEESFEEVIIQKHQQNLPSYSSWPFSQTTTEEVTTDRYYLPSTVRTDDPLSAYNTGSYRTFQTTPITTVDEVSNVYYSPTQNSYSTASTITEEVSSINYPYNYKAHKTSLLKSPEESSSTYHPANHRRYYTQDVAVSHHPSSFGGNTSPAVITTEELSASLHPARHRAHYSPSAHTGSDMTRYMTQSHYPTTVTTVEETVVEVPATYTEGYHPTHHPGRYISTSGYPSSEAMVNSGYNRAYYPRHPMYQTNG